VANRNELTDLLAAGEDEAGDAYALVCLLGLNEVGWGKGLARC